MATEIVHIIDPDNGAGTDYTSLSAWEAAQARDLVTDDEIAVAICRCTGGTADTAQCGIHGWTTDSTRYIKVWTDPDESYRHNGTLSSGNIFRMEYEHTGNSQYAFGILEDFVRVIGLQIDSRSSGFTSSKALALQSNLINDGAEFYIEQCVIKTTLQVDGQDYSNGVDAAWVGSGTRTLKISNCLIYGNEYASSDCGGLVGDSGWNVYAYNLTVRDCWDGIYSVSGVINAKNCIVQDCSETCYAGTFHASSEYNCSDDGTHPGSNGVLGEVTFLDEAGGDFHLDGTDTVALDAGLDLSGDSNYPISVDIDNETRSGWSIGMDDFFLAQGEFFEVWELGQGPRIFYTEGGADRAMDDGALGYEKIKVHITTLNTKEQIYSDS